MMRIKLTDPVQIFKCLYKGVTLYDGINSEHYISPILREVQDLWDPNYEYWVDNNDYRDMLVHIDVTIEKPKSKFIKCIDQSNQVGYFLKERIVSIHFYDRYDKFFNIILMLKDPNDMAIYVKAVTLEEAEPIIQKLLEELE